MKHTALIFPGQGSQTVGMAQDFYKNFRECALIFEEASDAIRINIAKLCFEGPTSDLTLTENLQPCLFTAEMAMFTALRIHTDIKPSVFAGHSLGEYTALAAAGSLTVSHGAYLTRQRGQAMQTAVPPGQGTMAAILGLEASQVEALCTQANEDTGEVAEPANFNAPGQVVIAGTSTAVARACELLKTEVRFGKGKSIALQVSAPFHCSLMKKAQTAMLKPLSTTVFQKPSAPLIHNVTAQTNEDVHQFATFLSEQITHPVRWQESMELLPALQITQVVEVGPGAVLSGLLKRINRNLPCLNINSMENLKSIKGSL